MFLKVLIRKSEAHPSQRPLPPLRFHRYVPLHRNLHFPHKRLFHCYWGGGDIRPLIILSPFSGQMKVGFSETKQNQEVLNSSKTDTDIKTECSNFKNRNLNQSPHLKASGRARNILAIQNSAPKYMPHPNFAKSLLIADHKIPSTQTKSLHV